jgi:hypothetical protein
MPLEGHPIPEHAIIKEPRLMTYAEAAELFGRFRWGQWLTANETRAHSTIDIYIESESDLFTYKIRKWGSAEWIDATVDILEKCREEK